MVMNVNWLGAGPMRARRTLPASALAHLFGGAVIVVAFAISLAIDVRPKNKKN